MEKMLAFVDLLGFSNMVNQNEDKAREVLNDFYNISFTEIKKLPSVNGHLFSDSLLAYSNSKQDLINCLASIYKKCLLKNKHYLERDKFFLLPRGAMSVGIVNVEDRETVPNLTKDFIVSPALVHSAKLESTIKGSRLLVAIKNEDKQNFEIAWNKGVKYALYEDEGLTFLANYKYRDVLWYSSFNDGRNEREEIVDLIDIAINLIKDNARNEKAVVQHVWTLRIGLLNYTKYLGLEQDTILKRIIDEFEEDKYWILWMTLIEIIVSSNHEWKYAVNNRVISFYKKFSLKPGWGKLIEEINRPGQEYILHCFRRFIDEMSIISR